MSPWVKSPTHLELWWFKQDACFIGQLCGFLMMKFKTHCGRLNCGTQKLQDPSARVILPYYDLIFYSTHCPKPLPGLLDGSVGQATHCSSPNYYSLHSHFTCLIVTQSRQHLHKVKAIMSRGTHVPSPDSPQLHRTLQTFNSAPGVLGLVLLRTQIDLCLVILI